MTAVEYARKELLELVDNPPGQEHEHPDDEDDLCEELDAWRGWGERVRSLVQEVLAGADRR